MFGDGAPVMLLKPLVDTNPPGWLHMARYQPSYRNCARWSWLCICLQVLATALPDLSDTNLHKVRSATRIE